MNVWPLLNIFGYGKSIKSPCHRSSTPLATVWRGWKLCRTRCCKGYRDAQSVGGERVQLSPNLWRCVQLFSKRQDSIRAVELSCEHALLRTFWRWSLHRHAINEYKTVKDAFDRFYASFQPSWVLLTQMILEKAKKNKVSLRTHDRSGCVRRQIDAKRWLLNLQRGFL